MIDIVGKKHWFFTLSIVLTLLGVLFYFINGVKLDIQFEGGTAINIRMNDDKFTEEKVKELIKKSIGKEAQVFKLSSLNASDSNKKDYMMKIQISKSQGALSEEQRKKLNDDLKADKSLSIVGDKDMDISYISPSYGSEMRDRGLFSFGLASLLIIFYIAIRFTKMGGWAAGVSAVLALVHDTFITLTVYMIANIPINDSFIAAMLTILGYSINDTIIIYDRIRENSGQLNKMSLDDLVNKSITQTLGRSINTVVTVLICVISVYVVSSIYQIESLQQFSFPLIVGITSGCYSSIFIASPLWLIWKKYQNKRRIALKAAK